MVGQRQVIGLDLLRFLAALLVLMFHLTFWIWYAQDGETARAFNHAGDASALGSAFDFGWVGVQIFFVISGFVIAYTANGRASLAFAKSRMLRLYPEAILCATVTFIIGLSAGVFTADQALMPYLRSVTLFPKGTWIDGVYWSLRVELMFYLLVFGLLVFKSFKHIERVMMVVGLASTAFCVATTLTGTPGLVHLTWAHMSLLSYGCCFALGVTFWCAMQFGFTARRAMLGAVYTIGALAPMPGRFGATAGAIAFVLSIGLFWLSIQFNDVLSQWVNPRLVRTLGMVTYPVYLLHDVAGAAVIRMLVSMGLPYTASLAITIALTIGAAFVIVASCDVLVRKPLRNRAGSVIFALR